MATIEQTTEKLNELFTKMNDLDLREQEAEEALNDLRILNAERLSKLQIDFLNKKTRQELELQQEVFQKYLEDGGRMSAILAREERRNKLRALEELLQKELEGKSETQRATIVADAERRRKTIEREFEERLKHEVGLREEIKKLDDAEDREKRKRDAKEALDKKKKRKQEIKDTYQAVASELGTNL